MKAELSRLAEIRRFVERAADEFGFGATDRAAIKMAVNEAAANAIEHGSSAPDATVEVSAVEEGDALAFSITDSGTFPPDPRAGEDTMRERGWGLHFMRTLMDEVEIIREPDGTVVKLRKRPEPAQ